jgi:spore germination protein YaaH
MFRFILIFLIAATASCLAQDVPGDTPHARQQLTRPMPVASASPHPQLPREAGRELSHVVFGYHPYWIADAVTLGYDFSLLSHLAYFSGEVDAPSGEFLTVRDWHSAPVLDRARAAGVKIQLAVTNFGAADNRSLLSAPAARDTLIRRIVAMLQERAADGVSIDFEAVPGDQRDNLTAFFAALDAALAAALPDAEISAAVPAVDWNDAWDVPALREHIDLFFLMCYDYFWSSSSTAGPVSPIQGSSYNVTRSLTIWMQKGTPAGRLVLGVPYYGYDWPVTSDAPGAATTGRATARTYSYVNSMPGVQQKQWSETYRNPWFPYGSGDWRQVWFDDVTSLGEKYDLVRDLGLAGTGIWALGYDADRPELWELLRGKFTRVTAVAADAAAVSVELSLYPQPARSGGVLTVLLGKGASHGRRMEIADLLGRVRWTGVAAGDAAAARIPLVALPSGVYILSVREGPRRMSAPLMIAD